MVRIALGLVAVAVASSVEARAQTRDDGRLAPLMTAQGFVRPERFKAIVGEIQVDTEGLVRTAWFDWHGTSDDRDDWWPASSVKLYAAIAALAKSRALGCGPDCRLTFHDEGAALFRMQLSRIVRRAIVASDNHAFNRLVEFVGFDALHEDFFTLRNGLGGTVFLRAYSGRHLDPNTGYGSNRRSPRITLRSSGQRVVLDAREGRGEYGCPDQGNCTTLRELAESLRRVVLHERLPPDQRFALGEGEVALLREVLAAPRRRHGRLLLEAFQQGIGDDVPLRFYHKPGYAYRWSSEVLFVHRLDTDERWVLALAGWPGRRVLDDALRILGRVFASRGLSATDLDPRGR